MKVFKTDRNSLSEVDPKPFRLEKDIQSVVEPNTETIFNLRFIQTELTVGKYRIDSLCFDEESNSFVIIEYKRGNSYSVIDQGYTYLQLLLNNKSDFLLVLSQHFNRVLRKEDVDWSQSRIVFVSPSFNSYQKDSVNFKDLPFELWEIKRYSNGTIVFNQHRSSSKESIETLGTTSESPISKVSKVVKVYSEDEHLKGVNDHVKELYHSVRDRVLELDSEIEVVPRKKYIGFRRGFTITDISFQKTGLKCWVNMKKGDLDDPLGISRDVSSVGHYGNGDYEVKLTTDSDLDYFMVLVKQSYNSRV